MRAAKAILNSMRYEYIGMLLLTDAMKEEIDLESSEMRRTLGAVEELLMLVSELKENQSAVPILQSLLDDVQVNINRVPSFSWLQLSVDKVDVTLVKLRDFMKLYAGEGLH